MFTADATIDEARTKLRKLVEYEKGLCGGNVPKALYQVTAKWGIDPGPVNSLWHNRMIKSVKGHILDTLRQADEIIKECAKRQRAALEDTANTFERYKHPAARLARMAAEAAREKAEVGQATREQEAEEDSPAVFIDGNELRALIKEHVA